MLSRQIAACTGIPGPYLSRILHTLGKSDLIRAKRGYRGGFTLSRPGERISLLDVAEAVEGRSWAPRCLLGLERCSDRRGCSTHAFWKRERARIEATLRRTTLAEVAAFERRTGGIHFKECRDDGGGPKPPRGRQGSGRGAPKRRRP